MRSIGRFAAAVGVVVVCTCSAQAVVIIDTVPVGNPGNPNDTHGDGYGRVGYPYNIGKFEITAGQYTEFLNAVAAWDTYLLYDGRMGVPRPYPPGSWGCNIRRAGSSGSYRYSVAADWADRPVNWVSWGDAARFANWLHNGQPTGYQGPATTEDGSYFLNGTMTNTGLLAITREPDATWVIPSENEWYKAAYHKNDGVTGNYFDYPTSSGSVPSNNLDGGGNNATFRIGSDPEYDYTIGSPYYRTEVGAHRNSGSPYGTFDQGGNVWEWNETLVDSRRGMRGGGFNYAGRYLLLARFRSSYPPYIPNNDIGFRVAYIPEPATVSLLVLGGLLVTRRRR